MPRSTSFHDYVVYELLAETPEITSKAMFGGWGIYMREIIFAIIIGEELYFKVDDSNRKDFEAMDSRPFTYKNKNDKSITMSYWLVPEEIMENREYLRTLVHKSVAANKKK